MDLPIKLITVKPTHGSLSKLSESGSGVHPRPINLPKQKESKERKKASDGEIRGMTGFVKDACATLGYKFVVLQPSPNSQGMTICYKEIGFDLCEVSTAILNQRDRIVPIIGKYTALNRCIEGKSILLKRPHKVRFQDYLRVVFSVASAR